MMQIPVSLDFAQDPLARLRQLGFPEPGALPSAGLSEPTRSNPLVVPPQSNTIEDQIARLRLGLDSALAERGRLEQDLGGLEPKAVSSEMRPGATAGLALAALLGNMLQRGAGDQFAKGFLSGNEIRADRANAQNKAQVQSQQSGLMAQIRSNAARMEYLQKLLSGLQDEKASAAMNQRMLDVARLQADAGTQKAQISAQSGERKEMIKLIARSSPQARRELGERFLGDPDVAQALGELTEEEKLKASHASLNSAKTTNVKAKTEEINALLPGRIAKLLAEGKGALARSELDRARVSHETAQTEFVKTKTAWYPKEMASRIRETENRAYKHLMDANAAVYRAMNTKGSGDTLKAIGKLEDAAMSTDAHLAELRTEGAILKQELQKLSKVEFADTSKLQSALASNQGRMAYYQEMKKRIAARKAQLNQGGAGQPSGAFLGAKVGIDSGTVDQASRRFLGTPYVWGGQDRSGIDCSGLACEFLKSLGVNVGDQDARTLFSNPRFDPVSKDIESWRPGDLLFFNTSKTKNPGHVAVYLGNGRMRHASSSKGEVIDVPVTQSWRAKLVGTRRVKG